MTLAHDRGGSGEPLLLVHGIGSQWQMWAPVLPALRARHDVIALDLPGFGESPLLTSGAAPSAPELARAVAGFMDELGLESAHVAGNSLGGWISLELAKLGRTRSVCALSPAGFAEGWDRTFALTSLRNAHSLVSRLRPRLARIVSRPRLKWLFLAQLVAHPARMPTAATVEALENFASCPGFAVTFEALAEGRFSGGDEVRGPVTIAWGEKDRLLLPRQAERARAEVPQARHITLVDCGHVPTFDDPELVARAILTSAAA